MFRVYVNFPEGIYKFRDIPGTKAKSRNNLLAYLRQNPAGWHMNLNESERYKVRPP
jgi:hypothetical protein